MVKPFRVIHSFPIGLLLLIFTVFTGHSIQAQSPNIAEHPQDVTPLDVNDSIPDVTVQRLDGRKQSLKKLVTGQKSALIVFRGGWCPYCTRHLAGLQTVAAKLKENGYQILALTPDRLAPLKETGKKDKQAYTLLLDPSFKAVVSLGLAFTVGQKTIKRYRKFNIPLYAPPGTETKVLPVPAVYLISETGTIQFAHWQSDYKHRLDPDEILLAAQGKLMTKTITYTHNEQTMKGTIAWDPSRKEKRPGIVVIHEWWGLNAYAREQTRQLAAMGYVALAADMYGNGTVATDREEAAGLAKKLRSDRKLMRSRARKALDVLKDHDQVDKTQTAAIGFCFGGGCVLELARSGADLSGVVSFHGNLDTPEPDKTQKPRAAILVCHGAADPHVPFADIQRFTKEMNRCNADWTMIMYGNAVHAFTNPDAGNDPSTGAAYNKTTAQRAWSDMKEFFDRIFLVKE